MFRASPSAAAHILVPVLFICHAACGLLLHAHSKVLASEACSRCFQMEQLFLQLLVLLGAGPPTVSFRGSPGVPPLIIWRRRLRSFCRSWALLSFSSPSFCLRRASVAFWLPCGIGGRCRCIIFTDTAGCRSCSCGYRTPL